MTGMSQIMKKASRFCLPTGMFGVAVRMGADRVIEKRSRYCKHGNVWGRCPYGC